MARPPNFIGTTIQSGAPYINNLPQVPPIVLPSPSSTVENSVRAIHIPAPLQPATKAAINASTTAIDRLKELFSRIRS